MSMKEEVKNKIKTLQVLKDKETAKKHSKELGMSVPSNYFQNSKKRILESIIEEKSVAHISNKKAKYTWIAVAATIAVLISVTIFNEVIFKTATTNIVSDTLNNIKNTEFNEENLVLLNSDDIMVTSLFVEDSKLDEFIDAHVLEEIIEDDLLLN